MTWLAVVIGLVAGVFSGLLGIGGGVIVVPLLTLLLGLSIREAIGTSLAALMLPVGIFGVLLYIKDQRGMGPPSSFCPSRCRTDNWYFLRVSLERVYSRGLFETWFCASTRFACHTTFS